MDSIKDMLISNRFTEPDEVQIIKQFVHENYNEPCAVLVRQNDIVISVKSAALAGTLRASLHTLQDSMNTKKKLLIRIG